MKPKPQEKSKRATNHSTQHHWNEMNHKQRREMMRKMQSEELSLNVIHPDAAGICFANSAHRQEAQRAPTGS
jgi:predicted RNA-binding protein with PUA-like domain